MKTTRIIAIDTSDRRGALALLCGLQAEATVECHRQLAADASTAAELIPALEELLAEASWSLSDVHLVTVVTGPGSFTGLRIGVTAAKTLAYSKGIQLVGVPTTEALAAAAAAAIPEAAKLWTIIDAFRGELFVQSFGRDAKRRPRASGQLERRPAEVWLETVAERDRVTGPGLRRVADRLPSAQCVDEKTWCSLAGAAGQLGWERFLAGQVSDPFSLVPDYHRKSAAEEKRDSDP